jgi:hypothetical protein
VLARQQRLEAPDSMIALPRSMRFTVPVTELVAARQEVVQDLLALGVADALQDAPASAVCAPMRPNSTFGSAAR